MINFDSGTCAGTVEFFLNAHAFRRNTTAALNAQNIKDHFKKAAGLICRSQVAGHCFTNTESVLNILKS